jgi:RNA 3'-terminal phosphate cyclase (ATP)
MLTIDGSMGEGGGQILRSSLTLSLVTGTSFQIEGIRSGRKNPGLQPQHLRAVAAAATVGGAAVAGADLGSTTLRFQPGRVKPGRYHFKIGTAGATSLVLQTVYLPLALAGHRSVVEIMGGTHVPFAPPFDYLEEQWLWALGLMGLSVQVTLVQAGFYPKGGGTIVAEVLPQEGRPIRPINLTYRGGLLEVVGRSAVANLPDAVGERQRRQAERRLAGAHIRHTIELVRLPAFGKCTVMRLTGRFGNAQSCHVTLGAVGKPAERVADEAVNDLFSHLDTEACLDRHLADQVLLPLALASGPSAFSTSKITPHLTTNAAVIQQFLPARIEVEPRVDGSGLVRVTPNPA